MGGSLGYALGAINWDITALGKLKLKDIHMCASICVHPYVPKLTEEFELKGIESTPGSHEFIYFMKENLS